MKLKLPERKEIDPNGLFSDKQHEAFQMFADNYYWDDICKIMEVDRRSLHAMVFPIVRLATSWQMNLSVRTQNGLSNARVYTKSQALEFIAQGGKARNFGKKSLAELRGELSMPEDVQAPINWGITSNNEIRFPKGSQFSIATLEKIIDYAKKATGII